MLRLQNIPKNHVSQDEIKALGDLLNQIEVADSGSLPWVLSQKAIMATDLSSVPDWATVHNIIGRWGQVAPEDQRLRTLKQRIAIASRPAGTQPH